MNNLEIVIILIILWQLIHLCIEQTQIYCIYKRFELMVVGKVYPQKPYQEPKIESVYADSVNITEDGKQPEDEINKRCDKIEKKGIRFNLRLRAIEEKFEDEKLEALSNALGKRDNHQGKQIESNTQKIIKFEKELKEISKRLP